MHENKEMDALFQLIDDPDEEVFGAVSEKIIHYGKDIIPNLEHLWERTIDTSTLVRIEKLIHRLHFYDLKDELTQWAKSEEPNLLTGALLVAKYQYPELQTGPVFQEIERLRRNIWLELNSYLTPLEQVNVVTSILYNYFNLKGSAIDYKNKESFLLPRVLESKTGNSLSNGILYIILSELLDVPVQAVKVPNHFLMAYFSADLSVFFQEGLTDDKPLFFIDPMSGQLYAQQEIEAYLESIQIKCTPDFYEAMTSLEIIHFLVEEYALCYKHSNDPLPLQELNELSTLLKNEIKKSEA